MKLIIPFIILILLFSFNMITSAEGIILANNQEIINIFRSYNKINVKNLIEELDQYEKIILHLGAKYVFEKGNAFYYITSQENLKYFCDKLSEKNIKLYLWFLDSFGSQDFMEIYQDYKNIIDSNYKWIEKLDLKYEGIIIDLEWINLNSKSFNNKKYLEIAKYLNNKFLNKELYAFAPLIDNENENIKRGYNKKEVLKYLDNIIPMLYIKDGGYYLKDKRLSFYLDSNRIEDLKKYYFNNNFIPAISIEDGIILERNNNLYFIKTTNDFKYLDKVKQVYKKEEYYNQITGYKPLQEFSIERNDSIIETIKTNDTLHYYQLKTNNLLDNDIYLWEYFILKGYKPE